MGFMFVIYMFLSNNPSSGDMNSSNLSCFLPLLTQSDSIYRFKKMSIYSASAAVSSRPRKLGRGTSTTRASFKEQIINDRTEKLRR